MPTVLEWNETSDSLGFTTNQDGSTTIDRSFRIRFDEPVSDVRVIYSDSRFPKPFSPHPHWPGAFATSPSARARFNGRVWEATVPYSTELPEQRFDPNPLARPAIVTWNSQTESIPTVFDADGKPMVNTAGELLIGEERRRTLWEIQVQKNVVRVPRWVKGFQNCTNQDAVRLDGETFAPETLLLDRLTIGEVQQENNVRFRGLSMTLLFDEFTWVTERANRGFHELVTRRVILPGEFFGSDRLTLVPIRDADGKMIDEPAFLDRRGQAYRDKHGNVRGLSDSAEGLKPGEIILLKKRKYRKKPFSRLPLK